tara:strand:- start:1515 stop:2105 length:591 start_codon:yes stop_codon:yes gene_type:complete
MRNMAMRSQVYEFTAASAGAARDAQNSIFTGGPTFGTSITKPAETTATQFVVIEQVASSGSTPATYAGTGIQGYTQVRINTTGYFLKPDNIPNDGVPGAASPYPRSVDFQPSFNLYPDVYVLPGQVWDVLYVTRGPANTNDGLVFVKYTLYDGPDALIANKLLELGISVSPANVDWYKRSLISAQSAPAPAPANGA